MKKIIVALILTLCLGTAGAVEQIDLTAPVTIASYVPVELHLDLRGAEIRIVLYSAQANKDMTIIYSGPTAVTLMQQMNKMNFSTNSMMKVMMNKLITDGKIAGTISGSPD